MGDVEVEVDLPLAVQSGPEVERGLRPQRRVDGVGDEQVHLVGADARAGVPDETVRGQSADAGDHRRIRGIAAELRREAARQELLEREAVRIVEDGPERRRVRPVVGDRHRRTVRGPVEDAVLRVERVADQQRPAPVGAVDPPARVRVPKVETAGHGLARVVGVPVELHAVVEQVAEVAEQLQVVVDRRRPPDLHRVGDRGVAGVDQRLGVVPLHAAAGGAGVAVLQAEVGESGRAERQAGVAGDGVRPAVTRAVRAGAELEAPA